MLQTLLRRSALAAGLAAASLAAPAVASAQSGFWAQVQVGSPLAGYGLNNGAYVATGTITGLNGNTVGSGFSGLNMVIDKFFCTDQQNTISLPSTYIAWISYISPNSNMSQTRIGSRNPASPVGPNTIYTLNASLANTITLPANNASQAVKNATYAANNTAQSQIWNNAQQPSTPNYGNSSFNTNGWFVVTAPPGQGQFGGTQELLAYSSTVQTLSTVPEPGTYALLVPALLIVGGVARRRRSVAQLA